MIDPDPPRPGLAEPDRFHVILVEPEIAGNVGAIGRTCVAVGARLWLVRPLGFHLDDRRRRRAGLDYWDHLDWTVADGIEEVEAAFRGRRLWSFTTRTDARYDDAPIALGDGLVFGPESRGLSPRWLADHADSCLRIPIRPEARSLNLGTAVAVALFEADRRARSERGD